MLKDLAVHQQTMAKLRAYLTDVPQAIVLVGASGLGKFCLAESWATELLGLTGQVQTVKPDEKGVIGIDAIRGLYRQTRSKQSTRQVIIIDNAGALGIEAQNAFLKLLEEPRSGLTFVLTAVAIKDLLPTITSRLQIVDALRIADDALKNIVVGLVGTLSEVQLRQLLFIADGRPAAAVKLASDETFLNQEFARMALAKRLLVAKPYDMFAAINALATDRQACINTLSAMLRMSALQLARADAPEVNYWSSRVFALELALEQILNNGNTKTQLLNAFASFG